ncbi:MAG TPA: hypothetical protein VGL38_08130 [bacterium]|jgi:hypothetical protein
MTTTKTKDFGLAAMLVAKNTKMTGYTTDELGNLWFEFATDENVAALEEGFYRNTVDVRIQDFLAAQKMLKALIFETKRNMYENRIRRFNPTNTNTIAV